MYSKLISSLGLLKFSNSFCILFIDVLLKLNCFKLSEVCSILKSLILFELFNKSITFLFDFLI